MKKQTKQNKLKNYNVYIDIEEIYSVKARDDDDARAKAKEHYEKADIVWTINDADISAEEDD